MMISPGVFFFFFSFFKEIFSFQANSLKKGQKMTQVKGQKMTQDAKKILCGTLHISGIYGALT